MEKKLTFTRRPQKFVTCHPNIIFLQSVYIYVGLREVRM